ncbi:cation transporter [Psychromonas sp. MB-3u-54]|uniref:cation diffusion facilitator family transporter n=1 Tax=Psychromonas sp. MB-3u-54 TaxID=2058319 RepID=UPI000C325400|nr:cation diffusion facilitator family transporter [Psychromonas sp. MB-3u-54]PKH04270.1 cation transporter [Psychromonas sp. MB-3u-54]
MRNHSIQKWQQRHDFTSHNRKSERRAYYVLILTVITMVIEIIAGTIYGSMALLADGWHMGTHAVAFMITIFAYQYARKHANNESFTFGTGKASVLGGFSSAIALGLVAVIMLGESVHRLMSPQEIQFNEAILVAVIGLSVNILSVFLLKDDHQHNGHQDHNLKAAYFHVLADALTSLLAIFALLAGKYWGLNWVDALMGIVGSVIITRWAIGLIKQTGPILLDASIEPQYQQKIITTLEMQGDNKVSDIHIWKVSADHYAAMISLVTHDPKPVDHYKQLLDKFNKIDHLTIEVNHCTERH